MAPSFSGVWNISTFYQYTSAVPSPPVNGILAGGFNSGYANRADYQTINFNDGNGTDQGDLTLARYDIAGFGSTTRAVFAGGYGSSVTNVVDYVEHAALGNGTDFGDQTVAGSGSGAHSSNTRGLVASFTNASGVNTENKTIDYYTIASTGNATDFGDLSSNRNSTQGGGNTTRAIFFAGYAWGSGAVNVIDSVTIATTGDATDFGDASNSIYTHHANVDSTTRSIFFGGYTGSHIDVIEYVTIASRGNATDFGNLDQAQSARSSGLSNGTIGILAGDVGGTSANNQKITIASTGNATDFGTLQTYGGTYMAYQGSASPHNPAVQPLDSLPSAIGLTVGYVDTFIEAIDITTLGNSVAFGDITYYRNASYGGASSSTRMCIGGGYEGGYLNNIDLTIFSTRGKGTDFGNLTVARGTTGGSNSTRGIFAGGSIASPAPYRVNTIDYITIASAGNASDFGDLTTTSEGHGMAASTSRMVIFGAREQGGYLNTIQYVTIASTGNATDFGDLAEANGFGEATSNSTRAVHCGGYTGSVGLNSMQYVTIASTGNATDFGDLTRKWTQGAVFGNSTRGIVAGGYDWDTGGAIFDITYFTIASTGDAADFGDLTFSGSLPAGASNGHGGIA